MNAKPIIDALAALRAVKSLPTSKIALNLWVEVMKAHDGLELAIQFEGIEIPVKQEVTE